MRTVRRWVMRFNKLGIPGLEEEQPFGGYVYGALQPSTGAVFTEVYSRRNVGYYAEFLEKVEKWVPPEVKRIYAIVDNLASHGAYDVMLFSLAYPRWEFVFQPKYAGYLNLIEPGGRRYAP